MVAITWDDDTPILGPTKPVACLEGPTSHDWQFSIEEGQITLTSGCRLCDDGLFNGLSEFEDWAMEPIPVRVSCDVNRDYLGDAWPTWYIEPQPDRST